MDQTLNTSPTCYPFLKNPYDDVMTETVIDAFVLHYGIGASSDHEANTG